MNIYKQDKIIQVSIFPKIIFISKSQFVQICFQFFSENKIFNLKIRYIPDLDKIFDITDIEYWSVLCGAQD